MDIKDLNKSQLILLAVLLSFITSIATGITTVTLMQQAPPAVTVPVNRVIRETVEKIQQVEGATTVQTVVVKEEDLVVDAIAKNRDAVFAVTKEENSIETSAGRGFAVSAEGVIAADAALVPGDGRYYIENGSGKFRAEFLTTDKGVAFLKAGAPVQEGTPLKLSVPPTIDVSTMKIGQKVILFGKNIATFIFDEGGVNIAVSRENGGSLVVNIDGAALGIALHSETADFVPMKTIQESLAAILPAAQR